MPPCGGWLAVQGAAGVAALLLVAPGCSPGWNAKEHVRRSANRVITSAPPSQYPWSPPKAIPGLSGPQGHKPRHTRVRRNSQTPQTPAGAIELSRSPCPRSVTLLFTPAQLPLTLGASDLSRIASGRQVTPRSSLPPTMTLSSSVLGVLLNVNQIWSRDMKLLFYVTAPNL